MESNPPPAPHPEPFCLVLIYHLFLIATLALLTTEFVAPTSIPHSPLHPFPWTLFLHQLATFLILDTTLLTLISLQTPILATIPEDLTSRTPRNIHP